MSSGVGTAGPEEQEEISLPDVWKRHPNEWVAMIVTKRDENLQPTAGKVVGHHVDRYTLRMNVAKYKDICILYAGEAPYPLFL